MNKKRGNEALGKVTAMECPKCGKPMKIIVEQGHTSRQRLWRCKDWSRFGSEKGCLTIIEIPDDEQLSIANIADDMARQAFTLSGDQRKKQAGYRRLAGGLSKLDAGRQYLSNTELQTLMEAAGILERLGTAAEHAKKAKKRLEEQEKKRIEQRENLAKQVLNERYAVDDLRAKIIVACAFSAFDSYSYRGLTASKIREAMRWVNDNPDTNWANSGYLVGVIKSALRSTIDEQIRAIGSRHEPVPDSIDEAMRKVDVEIEKQRGELAGLLDEVDEWMVKRRLMETSAATELHARNRV